MVDLVIKYRNILNLESNLHVCRRRLTQSTKHRFNQTLTVCEIQNDPRFFYSCMRKKIKIRKVFLV